jgi:hypothetical protein
MFRGFPCRYQADALASFRINNRQKDAVRDADYDHPLLAVSGVNFETVVSKSIIENANCVDKVNPVLAKIALGFRVVPFEFLAFHPGQTALCEPNSTMTRYMAQETTGEPPSDAHDMHRFANRASRLYRRPRTCRAVRAPPTAKAKTPERRTLGSLLVNI